ncbi:hypothetical protein CEP54_004669 [Fusarium duplospermum]|uniref:Uncharacterized protein n=1 Tax=Fusarium duplospermum TaxID=1325734 RepID=A0A428QGY3_9HYPO|nr:hypothetical protein CEP54_004669 [Fusarium duplospermum]
MDPNIMRLSGIHGSEISQIQGHGLKRMRLLEAPLSAGGRRPPNHSTGPGTWSDRQGFELPKINPSFVQQSPPPSQPGLSLSSSNTKDLPQPAGTPV